MRILDSRYFKFLPLLFLIMSICWSIFIMLPAINDFEKWNGSAEMLDISPKISADSVYKYVDGINPRNRDFLVSFYLLEDFVYPMIYGPFLLLSIIYYQRKLFLSKKIKLITFIIPIAMVVCDYMENFSIIHIIKVYPGRTPVASCLGIITIAKWLLGITSILMILRYIWFLRSGKRIPGDI